MNTPAPPNDELIILASHEVQKEAALIAQDGFTRIFRIIAEGDEAAAELGLSVIEARARDWAATAATEEARTLRLALLISGLDQWGLAWTQAFDLPGLPGLPRLLGNLRTSLDVQASARFEQQFAEIEAREENAIDFKVELRRGIHLSLWHAIAACEHRDDAERLTQRLGSLMLALAQSMPVWGWRLLSDSIAHIQIRLLQGGVNSEFVQDATQNLFMSLSHALGRKTYDKMMAQAREVVLAYQRAQTQSED